MVGRVSDALPVDEAVEALRGTVSLRGVPAWSSSLARRLDGVRRSIGTDEICTEFLGQRLTEVIRAPTTTTAASFPLSLLMELIDIVLLSDDEILKN